MELDNMGGSFIENEDGDIWHGWMSLGMLLVVEMGMMMMMSGYDSASFVRDFDESVIIGE